VTPAANLMATNPAIIMIVHNVRDSGRDPDLAEVARAHQPTSSLEYQAVVVEEPKFATTCNQCNLMKGAAEYSSTLANNSHPRFQGPDMGVTIDHRSMAYAESIHTFTVSSLTAYRLISNNFQSWYTASIPRRTDDDTVLL